MGPHLGHTHPLVIAPPCPTILAGPIPAIPTSACAKRSMDHRDKPGGDEGISNCPHTTTEPTPLPVQDFEPSRRANRSGGAI